MRSERDQLLGDPLVLWPLNQQTLKLSALQALAVKNDNLLTRVGANPMTTSSTMMVNKGDATPAKDKMHCYVRLHKLDWDHLDLNKQLYLDKETGFYSDPKVALQHSVVRQGNMSAPQMMFQSLV